MKITFVKKILADGSPCPKCTEVQARLEESGHINRIDEIIVADETNENSPGALLAQELNVDRAPFFVVEKPDQAPEVYTVYLKFLKEVLEQKTDDKEELKEIMRTNPDLDFL